MIQIDGSSLSIKQIASVAAGSEKVELGKSARLNVQKSRKNLEKHIADGKTIYGINTGFGALMNVKIEKKDLLKLQENLIRSHSAGVGDPLDERYVRAMMIVRANSLSKGYSGVTEELIDTLLAAVNSHVTPMVPRYGSVGASGDLAPLAHVALCLMGESELFFEGRRMKSIDALNLAGIKNHIFLEKEGVAFINGTSAISGILAVAIHDARKLIAQSIAAASISLQALKGTTKAFTEWVVETRSHKGQAKVSSMMRNLLTGYADNKTRVQDAYSIRCIPQVHGAVLDTLDYCSSVLEREVNSVTDNPILNEEEVISAGNFHGEPVALASDFLSIALTDLGNIIERRIFRLTDSSLSGLPPFLTEKSGLNSGMMIPQYTAASLCNMNKVLAHPASSDTIPTSANQEDHVSMGMNSALKLSEIIKNLESIVAIEFLAAAQAADLSGVELSAAGKKMLQSIRKSVKHLDDDREQHTDIVKMLELMRSEEFNSLIPEL
ncbi:MAG: histidine ammonia-lyase [Thermoplasmataceae archaeon]|jgi:histidine ammonia-lyase